MFRFICRMLALATALLAGSVAAQNYPVKPIRLIVPFGAGGSTDILARTLGQRLGDALGQSVLVENRPGANTIIAYEATLNAPADGYTLLMEGFNGLVLNPNLYAKLPYDAENDFIGVGLVASSGFLVVVPTELPVRTLAEFVSYARANPSRVSLASAGIGNSTHVAAEMFLSAVKLKLAHVPYKGSSAALPDLVNGRVQVMFDTPITSMPFVKSGKLRALAVSGSKRLAAMPEVPTIAELGYPGFNAGTYYSVAARKGTPPAIIERLSQEIRRISAGADLAATFAPQGIDMSPGLAEELGAMLKTDRARFAKVIKDAGISIEQ